MSSILCGAVLLLTGFPAGALSLPPAAGAIDVTRPPYNADPSGQTDSTRALQRAMRDAASATPGVFTTTDRAAQIVYLPSGTYRVTEPLVFASKEILKSRPKGPITKRNYIQGHMLLIGESAATTRIVLKDASPAFREGRNAIITLSEKGFTNQDYFNWVMDITIDTGRGNPGAVGLNFVSNNIGGVKRVNITCPDFADPAATGLDLPVRGGGLGYLHDIRVEGCREGIRVSGDYPAFVFENIELFHQTEVGLLNENKSVGIRNLSSINQVPAIINQTDSSIMTVIESRLLGGAAGTAAVINRGHLYARNIESGGYAAVLDNKGKKVAESRLEEFSSEWVTLWPDTPRSSMSIPAKDIPELPWPERDRWTVFDTQKQDDDTQALQALIDSGAEQIFIKGDKGRLKLSGTLHLRKNLRRLHGGWTNMDVENRGPKGQPLFQFHTGTHDFMILEAFSNGQRRNTFLTFFHDSEKAVVLRDLMMGYGVANYRNSDRGGELYIENVVTAGGDYPEVGETPLAGWVIKNQSVYARNWNPEDYVPDLRLEGAKVFALGGKLGEVWGTHLEVTGGSQAEMLTFMLNTNNYRGMWFPERMSGVSVIVENADLALSAFEDGGHEGPNPILIKETRGGETRILKHGDAPLRRRGANTKSDTTVVTPLYRSTVTGPMRSAH